MQGETAARITFSMKLVEDYWFMLSGYPRLYCHTHIALKWSLDTILEPFTPKAWLLETLWRCSCLWAADCCCVDGATFCAVSSSKAAAAVWCPLRTACTAHCSLIRLELCISASSVYTLQCLLCIQCSSLAPVMLMPLPGQGGGAGAGPPLCTLNCKILVEFICYLSDMFKMRKDYFLLAYNLMQFESLMQFSQIS